MENPLAELFSRFVNEGLVLEHCKRCAVVPIYKYKGDRANQSNFRPNIIIITISLTPTISRVFEQVLLQMIEPV